MGQCISHKEGIVDYYIEKENELDHLHNGEKLLLLGPGESGKTTFLKQLIALFGQGHNPQKFIPIIYKNVYTNMTLLLDKWEALSKVQDEFQLPQEIVDLVQLVRDETPSTRLSTGLCLQRNVAEAMTKIWAHPIIKDVYQKYGENIQLLDSSGYFFDRLEIIGSTDFTPTTRDCVLARIRTNGVNEFQFLLEQHKFTITDPGGQRSERKKWIHLFEGCAAVVFFSAISEYDQYLYENEEVNRMDEALTLFEEIVTCRYFRKTPVILFLNKHDLFLKKIETVPVKTWNPDFPYSLEEQNDKNTMKWLKEIFQSKYPSDKKMYMHTTCMIDDSCRDLFMDVSKIVTQYTAQNLL